MMWLEVLAAGLFTFQATQSGWAVAVVSAARAAPLLLFGAVAGVLADAWNRRSILLGGLLLSIVSAGVLAILASGGTARPWHVALAAFFSGSVYATEFPARRRMVAESAGSARVESAVAFDSLTSYGSRCLGPLAGGLVYQHFGLAGAFTVSCMGNLAMLVLVAGTTYRQPVRAFHPSAFGRDLAAAFRFARRSPVLMGLLAVTITMNLCGYSYATLMTPIGLRSLGLNDALTGVLVAAEPAGAFCGGLLLTRGSPPGSRLGWLMGGVAILAVGLIAMAGLGALGMPLPWLCLALAAGGLGSAIYTNTQTNLVLAATPADMRSRIMGLLTVCIGSWPLGMLLAGGLAQVLPPLGALSTLALCALVMLAGIQVARRRRGGQPA